MITVGLAEKVRIKLENGKKKTIIAKIDTGATKSSIDTGLASQLKLGPVVGTKLVKSAHGNSLRPMVFAKIELGGRKFKAKFTLADRQHLKYRVLIGVNILKKGFLVDPSKK